MVFACLNIGQYPRKILLLQIQHPNLSFAVFLAVPVATPCCLGNAVQPTQGANHASHGNIHTSFNQLGTDADNGLAVFQTSFNGVKNRFAVRRALVGA